MQLLSMLWLRDSWSTQAQWVFTIDDPRRKEREPEAWSWDVWSGAPPTTVLLGSAFVREGRVSMPLHPRLFCSLACSCRVPFHSLPGLPNQVVSEAVFPAEQVPCPVVCQQGPGGPDVQQLLPASQISALSVTSTLSCVPRAGDKANI